MVRVLPLAVLAVFVSGCASEQVTAPTTDAALSTALSGTRTSSRQVLAFDGLINECFNGGGSESIRLSGSIVLTIQRITHLSGASIEVLHVTTQGVHGVGLTSGTRYQVMEHQNTITKLDADGTRSVQFVFSIRTIGAGRDNNELLTSRFRLIVAPDGTRTFLFDKTDHTCH